MERLYMTKEGYEKLQAEFDALNKRLKGEVAQEIGVAREKGDLSENAEYEAAKNKQASLSQKMKELASRLNNAIIINPRNTPSDIVSIGKKVTLLDLSTNEEMSYTILGEGDIDITRNIINYKSPLAKGLIGHKVGEDVEIKLPRGSANYKILAIEFSA